MQLSIPRALFIFLTLGLCFSSHAQTTFTESAASFGLNISGDKDGGHAWSDYDNDGDLDVLVLENQNGATRSYLMRNNGNNTFTNVRATLVPGMGNDVAERQAAWGDLNNDGRPDFMITSHGNSGGSGKAALQIYLQNASGTFGNGIGGNNPITVGRSGYTININPINAEGAGFFDFEGDGDLDIFFDSHNYGIELLRNNYINHTTHSVVNPPAASLFTHITTGNGSGVVQFGLNQFATDGDYGTAADVNDDGWVDIFMRKRDEKDFFLNQGGIFDNVNGADLAQAENLNKGGNGLWDLDNDGDLDAVWTENGYTQIFRNDGSGVFTPLGTTVFPGLPQPANTNNATSSAGIDALAGGDIDNDGDIDIILVGDNRSYLYINQLNSPTPAPGAIGIGAAMTFTLDTTYNFNSGADGEGTTMVDIDDDGDLDIYMNINGGGNQLWINNLPNINRNNHLIVDVSEDRDANGNTGGFAGRTAIGTNVLIRDCDGNIVSGLRQVNGVFGHGTQQPEKVHFGLPLGENQTYLIEVRYPNFYDPVDGFSRLIATGIAQPSTIAGTNHYFLTTTDAESLQNENPPVANDDLETVSYGNSVSVQISLFDNDSEPDGENFFIESVVQPAVGSVTIDDADTGLVTYTYSAGTPFPGTTFDYIISDAQVTLCPSAGLTDTATVTIFEPCADAASTDTDADGFNDSCDLDDDNDGILDCTESTDSTNNSYFAWTLNSPSGNLSMDAFNDPDLTNWVLSSTGDYTWSGITAIAPGSAFQVTNMPSSNLGEAVANNDYFQVTFTTGPDLIDPELNNSWWGWWRPDLGDSYYVSLALSEDSFSTYEFLSTDVFATDPGGGSTYAVFDLMEDSSYKLKSNTTYTARIYVYGQIDDSPENYSLFDDFRFYISACRGVDSDGDGNLDHLDLDSDNDGIPDNVEAQTTIAYNLPNNDTVATYGINNGINSAYLGGLTPTNTDGADEPDYLDLNSDNEGHGDTTEAGIALAGVDSDNDGLDDNMDTSIDYADPGGTIDDPLDPTLQLLDSDNDATTGGNVDFRDAIDNRPDNDLDGIVDVEDYDDDNDGILDVDEGCGNVVYNSSFELDDFTDGSTYSNSGANGAYIGQTFNSDLVTGWNYTQNLDAWREGGTWASALHGTQYIDIIGNAALVGNAMNEFSQQINTTPGKTYTLSMYWGEDYGHTLGETYTLDIDVIDASNSTLINETVSSVAVGIISGTRGPNNWFFYERSFTATTSTTTLRFSSNAPAPNFYSGANIDLVKVTVITADCNDTDSDGVPDSFDLDSDNDGIYDAVEAGHGQPHTNGIVNGLVGTDGVPDILQTDPNEELVNYTVSDSDSDGSIDSRELDSDNDGCNDVLEAGYSDGNNDGLLGPNPVSVDGNGLVTSGSDGYTVPVDGNVNSVYDFQEAGTAPAITGEPINRSVCPGADTTFSVTTTNADTFQWQIWNGSSWVDLTNSGIHSNVTTNTLNITNAQISDSGNQYQILVSNSAFSCSEETSNSVTLTVSEPSGNLGSNQRVCDGDTVTLDPSATGGTPGYTYLWNTGATTPTIDVTAVANPGGDFNTSYSVTVTDQNGCFFTENVVVRTMSRPSATVTIVDATCGLNNGSITFSFPDYPNRSGIEFSLDDQTSYEPNVADNSGSVTYSGLPAGAYDLWSRWGNNECPIDLGDFTINAVPQVTASITPTVQTVFAGDNGVFTATVSNADTFQWQVSTNGGGSFNDVSDGPEYTGTQTTTLTVNAVDMGKNAYLYRLLASNSTNSCPLVASNSAVLTVIVKTVITNRRITYRVKKN